MKKNYIEKNGSAKISNKENALLSGYY